MKIARQLALADRAVEVRVDEVQTRHRPEVTEQSRLYVLGSQRLAKQGVVEQVDLTHRQVVGGPPVAVDRLECLGCGIAHDARC